mmetsp:Transcript_3002/g.4621  ORF Transcript_3002/g.4621 Transcript_3002/m.4621 type:complete len:91 (-) Transcript_3002:453-725(-)
MVRSEHVHGPVRRAVHTPSTPLTIVNRIDMYGRTAGTSLHLISQRRTEICILGHFGVDMKQNDCAWMTDGLKEVRSIVYALFIVYCDEVG